MTVEYRKSIDPMAPYVPGRPIEDVQREFDLERVVKLASNENPLGCSPKAREAVIDSLDQSNYYPDGNCTRLRERLSETLGVKQGEIVFGAGADEVLAMIGKVFINPGDECVTASVTFSQYEASAVSMGGVMVFAPMKNNAYDLDAIYERITEKTKIIFLANPNNPTGTMFTAAEQESFLAKIPSRVLIVIDEAYAEFADDPSYPETLPLLKKYKNIILIKTFSKIYGLASLRVGYGIADEEIIQLFEKIRPPFNVTIQGQAAALAALDDQDFVRESFENNRAGMEYFCRELDAVGLPYIPSQANFVTVDVKRDSREVFHELMKRGYIVRTGYVFGLDISWIRVTIGTLEQMRGFVGTLKEVLSEQ
ncbi:MAG: histidinol-phosphate transaminase [Clostridiales bacterium]|jgi:histidinol-phosphate aminotransferase|nr:histidinol-phosphate transaminase [Clostridiales bacterium]